MGAMYIGRRRIRDHKPFGELTVSQILANSSNVGTVKLGLRLGDRTLHRYLVRFGFGQKTGLPLPGETAGLLRSVDDWQAGSMGSIPIGQEIGVTAIQLARAVSVIANGGWLVQPRIINLMIHPDGAGTASGCSSTASRDLPEDSGDHAGHDGKCCSGWNRPPGWNPGLPGGGQDWNSPKGGP